MREIIEHATIKDAVDNNGEDELHIECRTSLGTKNAFIVVDGDRLVLAKALCDFINTTNPNCEVS